MTFRKASLVLSLGLALVSTKALPDSDSTSEPVISKPFRTFVTIKKYNLENNGIPSKPISNVKVEISFPSGHKIELPEGGHYWSIGNNQSQEINRTFEVPYAFVQKDGFSFDLTMIRKGKKILPCHFDVAHLSQFNRSYVCRTDVAFQLNQQKLPDDQVAKEAIEVRVFSDLNSTPAEIPKDAVALK